MWLEIPRENQLSGGLEMKNTSDRPPHFLKRVRNESNSSEKNICTMAPFMIDCQMIPVATRLGLGQEGGSGEQDWGLHTALTLSRTVSPEGLQIQGALSILVSTVHLD